jgi:hypothetical protein
MFALLNINMSCRRIKREKKKRKGRERKGKEKEQNRKKI